MQAIDEYARARVVEKGNLVRGEFDRPIWHSQGRSLK
jgi:hypothetical protein